ncbi:MAG: tRNA (guanosine(37)-N1)-methyltransferase TrmD [Candidatus Pacebacteria bacterium]|nr:tRNA (guanosine(37)-N1)-methyltransferase TrmD [Candidatus Paceibacterota bacterium]
MKTKKPTFHVITLFPELIESYTAHSIMKRGIEKKLFSVKAVNPRDFAQDKHNKADDRPYGGGPGMVLKAEPILRAVEHALKKNKQTNKLKTKILILSPRGKTLTNAYAKNLVTRYSDIVLIAGHYEGIDARVKKILKAEDVSVGPYVLTGGEMPALMIIDAAVRTIPGVLGTHDSLEEKRIASGDVYTRPETFVWKKKKYTVPAVLASGNHALIDAWRKKQ